MKTLEIIKGSTKPFDLFLQNKDGAAEDLSGVTKASLTVKEDITSAATPILQRDTVAGNLTVDPQNSKVVVTITQVEADALIAGTYVGEVAVEIGGEWIHFDRFKFKVRIAVAAHI